MLCVTPQLRKEVRTPARQLPNTHLLLSLVFSLFPRLFSHAFIIVSAIYQSPFLPFHSVTSLAAIRSLSLTPLEADSSQSISIYSLVKLQPSLGCPRLVTIASRRMTEEEQEEMEVLNEHPVEYQWEIYVVSSAVLPSLLLSSPNWRSCLLNPATQSLTMDGMLRKRFLLLTSSVSYACKAIVARNCQLYQ